MKRFSLAIHGGAGTILKAEMSAEKEMAYKNALNESLEIGHELLAKGGTSVEAVELAVKSLEDSHLFNAGKGSVFSADGTNEMEASIMEGQHLMAGAVAGVKNVKNPVALARMVMEKSEFVYLTGEGVMEFAREQGALFETDEYFFDAFRYEQWQAMKNSNSAQLDHSTAKDRKFGTVGAVALDVHGSLAAATSTGGLTNKKYGRVGDSSIIGAGNYANNATCAVSCTGYGEYFLRGVVAYDVSALMEYRELSLEDASSLVIRQKMVRLGGEGGLIAVDAKGNVSMPFNSEGMYRACVGSDIPLFIGIYK